MSISSKWFKVLGTEGGGRGYIYCGGMWTAIKRRLGCALSPSSRDKGEFQRNSGGSPGIGPSGGRKKVDQREVTGRQRHIDVSVWGGSELVHRFVPF